jgi:transposase
MKYIGVDLHKQVIKLCVFSKESGTPVCEFWKKFDCRDTAKIRHFFAIQGEYQVAVEATANYEWFCKLIEKSASRIVLVHPKKMQIIAVSTRKTDKIDSAILGEFLALDMLPEAWRPSPRIQEYRSLVEHRRYVRKRITSVKNKLRNKAAYYNADIPDLFSKRGWEYLKKLPMSAGNRAITQSLMIEMQVHEHQLEEIDKALAKFRKEASIPEREAREVLATIPQVSNVTIDVVLSALGDWRRFPNARAVTSYAGFDPGVRESAGKRKNLSISKEGSRTLRWGLIQAAWRLVGKTQRWRAVYDKLRGNTGSKKKAIVGVARRLLGVMFSMLQRGEAYRMAA